MRPSKKTTTPKEERPWTRTPSKSNLATFHRKKNWATIRREKSFVCFNSSPRRPHYDSPEDVRWDTLHLKKPEIWLRFSTRRFGLRFVMRSHLFYSDTFAEQRLMYRDQVLRFAVSKPQGQVSTSSSEDHRSTLHRSRSHTTFLFKDLKTQHLCFIFETNQGPSSPFEDHTVPLHLQGYTRSSSPFEHVMIWLQSRHGPFGSRTHGH